MTFRTKPSVLATILFVVATPIFAQADTKATTLKHLRTSKEFTLKVAGQMPDAEYGFKLTPAQMSFGEQIVHLAQAMGNFLEPMSPGARMAKPTSMKKADVIAYVTKSYDDAIARVSKITNDQLAKTYNGGEGTMTGLESLMEMLDHCTHHRASAEMYLRAKGITPTDYEY